MFFGPFVKHLDVVDLPMAVDSRVKRIEDICNV